MAYIDNFDLNSTAENYAITIANNGRGAVTKTTALVSSFKCAFWQSGSNESYISDRLKNLASYTLACAPRSDIGLANIIKINNIKYRVTIPDDILDYGEIMIVGCEKANP